MKATMSCDCHNATFSLWHIPTSTLLVSTNVVTEVERRIDQATSSGIVVDELMLNVEQAGSLVGTQHLGSHMLIALHNM
jgi:cytochrome c-type biogenesis protein CcmH/NrfF